MKILITIILIAIAFICLAKIADIGIRKTEKAECIKWEQQSREYQGWYSTSWQVQQCDTFDINLRNE